MLAGSPTNRAASEREAIRSRTAASRLAYSSGVTASGVTASGVTGSGNTVSCCAFTPPPCDENCDRKSDRRLLTITLSGVRRRRNRPPHGRQRGALGRSVRGGRGGLERPGQVGDGILH